MSAETFTTAMFLITAVIAAGVLINAVFPVVYTMAGTFQSATHESDQRLRTDFKIITMYAKAGSGGSPNEADVWMKNIGTTRIAFSDLVNRSDVFAGGVDDFDRLTYGVSGTEGTWMADFGPSYDTNNNQYWDPGETIKITAYSSKIPPTSGDTVYFQFILPDGILRSMEFTVS
ncbi:flagellin [Methanoregula sp.]|jgi:archaeal flagellar protein FlaG|uniref:flagellin n=1 Tax=Methanoregula sp. TaxID=2052170 RepID=UPI003C293AD2